MNDLEIYYSIEMRIRVQYFVLQSVTNETGLYLANENNTAAEDHAACAAIPGIVPDAITLFLMNLYQYPAIEERDL